MLDTIDVYSFNLSQLYFWASFKQDVRILFIAHFEKVGSILDLPCCFVILWFCQSVITFQMKLEYLWGQFANLDQILYEASLGWGKGCIRFWDRLDQNSGFHSSRKRPLTYNGENDVSTFSLLSLAHLGRRLIEELIG